MECRATILINNKWLFLMIHTNGDYNTARQIPVNQKAQLWRYELAFRIPNKRHLWKTFLTINKDCVTGLKITNFIFRIKKKLSFNQ